jgi:nucleoside 2-deoxyribosyltransferase
MRDQNSISIYLAAPLFTQAEWQWNQRLARALAERSLDVILPQSRAEPMLKGAQPFDAEFLFRVNVEGIERSDVVVAIFDGPDVDSGTSWECGYAFKAHRPVIGVRTDIRAGGDDSKAATNLMLSMSCMAIISVPFGERENVDWVASEIAAALRRITR